MAAAADIILQQGVARTTLDDVRAEAGVSSSQIYHYFADKEALVRAVVDYRAQTVVGEIHEPALAAIEGIEGLRAWRDMIVSIQTAADCRGGCPLGSLGSELAELDHAVRCDVAAGYARWEAAISACLAGMRDRGQLSAAADPGRTGHRSPRRTAGRPAAGQSRAGRPAARDGAGRHDLADRLASGPGIR